jgi:ABC-2 type transport system ATP-binding protein
MKTPVIEITELSKYYGKSRGIEKVNLQISDGEIFGFIGPNGAGKSTTIRILLNLIFPDNGSARIMGMDVIRKTKKIKELVGYVPSDANAYGYMTVLEFLQYCHRFYRLNDTLHRIDELSAWFELDLKRKISELSMGNRKKVSIVQSLLHKPRLLILDEPTTGLDPLMQAKFFELLRIENQKGMTIFFSSHILNEVQMLCKRVAIIKEGKIIRVEEIENLRRKQLKKVIIGLTGNWNTGNIILPGVLDLLELPGNRVSFMYSGGIPELITFLSGKMITDLTIEEPSLEEIFMHYYK